MEKYNPQEVEKKWQKFWEENRTFEVNEDFNKEKFYGLIEFPYPSGAGLHVGHPRSYTAMDIICRKRRMEGKNVLYPIGFDSFGLPTENFAIQTGRPPADITAENIATFIRQLKSLGFSFDWSRAVTTSEPKYYKWTQWIFLQLFKRGLAYKANQPINWCIKCKIGLANEEVVDGKCERCGSAVEKRDKEQWMLAITKYADKLLEGLKTVDFIERAKTQQENWIGRSDGALVRFIVPCVCCPDRPRGANTINCAKDKVLEVFTTRPDTLFGATYMVLAPEHEIIGELKDRIKNWKDVYEYIKEAKRKTDIERTEFEKEKTGLLVKGIKAINPANGEDLPVWVADYVLNNYGTGAVMAVPAHDERDYDFAKKFGLPVRIVVRKEQMDTEHEVFDDDGISINSDFLNGLSTPEAKENIIKWLEENGVGKRQVNYKLRDWVFSRQRYWGEPIPLVYCEKCADWIPLPESELPITLPNLEKYQPTDTGESPLALIDEWGKTKCPQCGGLARRETDTMPNWAGSSWYFLRYCDPNNEKEFASMDKLKYWMDVDWYNGGMEHTVLHLLYSRFWNQFLYDIGVASTREPYKKRTSHGMILAKGGEKMSKSKGNVVNPDEMVKKFGADALRMYIMFMGPFEQAVEWDTNGLVGVRRFLEKVWNLQYRVALEAQDNREDERLTHQTIRKVSKDIEAMSFNTAVSQLMILANQLSVGERVIKREYFEKFVLLLSVFAPHIGEELWSRLGNTASLAIASWPKYDEALAKADEIIVVVQVNGKVRDEFIVTADTSEEEIKQKALASERVKNWIDGKTPKKVIYVKGRLVSIVI